MMNLKTLQQAVIYFSDQDNCREYLAARRWPNGVTCPTCGRDDVRYLVNQEKWQCKSVHKKRQFTVKVGTIFEDSPLGLDKWLVAIWMITNCKNGISSYEVHRAIDVTQKTAWFMVHRIRVAMELGSFEKLSGIIEADETYIGGDAKNMHEKKRKTRVKSNGSTDHKSAVLGMVQRGGKVRAKVIQSRDSETIRKFVTEGAELGSEVMTDQWRGYHNLHDVYTHQVINHSIEYVNGNIHTNSIENFWSLLKRTIKGTYVSVEAHHLQKYIEEQMFRYNNRKDNDGQRFFTVTGQIAGKRLTYAELTGNTPESRKLSGNH
jgi:IS1 family transposase/transposase-like protein